MSQDELRSLVARMKILEAQVDELEEKAKSLKDEYDLLRLKRIPDLMANLEITNCTFDGLGRVQLANDLYASTREGKKQDAMRWLRDCGYEGMISETYNASSIKALFRRMIKDGTMPPDELFSVTPFVRASVVKV